MDWKCILKAFAFSRGKESNGKLFLICTFQPYHKACQLPAILTHFNEHSFLREKQVYRTTHNQSTESLFWSELKMSKSMIHHSMNTRTHLCPTQRTALCVCLSGLDGFDYTYVLAMLKWILHRYFGLHTETKTIKINCISSYS